MQVPPSAETESEETDRRDHPAAVISDPPRIPAVPRRIAVVGTMGAGKTTLARQAAAELGIGRIELDQFLWEENWTPAAPDTLRARIDEALRGNAWIADGNHEAARDIIWARADTLVWLDFPAALILFRLARRTIRQTFGRSELWGGNRDRLGTLVQRGNLLAVFRATRAKRRQYPCLLADPRFAHLRLVRLRSPRDARRWLRALATPSAGGAALSGQTVVQFADFGSPYAGNFIASLQALGRGLNEQGARQVLVLPERALPRPWLPELTASGATVYILGEKSGFPRTVIRIWRILARERATVAHVHFARYDIHVWLAAALRRLIGTRVAVLWHDHGGSLPPPRTARRRVKDAIKLRLMGRSARVMCVSPALRDDLLARGLPEERACVVANGIDLERARQAHASRDEVRTSLGLGETAFVFLAFGWDPYRKGIDLALAAMEQAAGINPEAVLLLVGTPAMEEFARKALGGSLPSWLRLAQSRESVGELYQAVDVFLAASREEGMPYSLAEAMANSLPVIASDIGGHAMYSAAAGVVTCAVDSAPALAEAIQSMVNWPLELRKERGAANRQYVEDRFSLPAWTRAIVASYRDWVLPGES
jgi:glycosyltransferase involved in cell wall biosynthesis